MRQIEVSTDVYARIWALRQAGEESENAILERVLFSDSPAATPTPTPSATRQKEVKDMHLASITKATWAHDLVSVLKVMGGKARLDRIYDEVEKLRRAHGRSVPRTLEATVRRTLENHSSHSANYLGGVDLFCMPEGKGAGVWALR
jgi:negative regulator of replication initiation